MKELTSRFYRVRRRGHRQASRLVIADRGHLGVVKKRKNYEFGALIETASYYDRIQKQVKYPPSQIKQSIDADEGKISIPELIHDRDNLSAIYVKRRGYR